jgi:imidazolonepropionase-like amidohydrolase
MRVSDSRLKRIARLALVWTSLVLIAIACTPATTPRPTAQPADNAELVLFNGTVIDGTGSSPIPDAVVVIGGERILAVGSRGSVAIPADIPAIDVQGGTILPGFINAHVHSGYNLSNLAAWAQSGVTTVRDLGRGIIPPDFAAREEAAADPRYARLVAAGPFITAPDGYPTAIFGSPAVYVSTPDEARQAVNDLLDRGADVIKIAVESGQDFGEQIPMLDTATVSAIVETAHARGTLVVAHVLVSPDLRRALDGGVDDIAHMVVDDLPDELIQRMVDEGVYWEPTLELWRGVGYGNDLRAIANLRRYAAAGGLVALGTDYDGYHTPFQLGMPMIEIEAMQEAGMSAMEIIVAGTRNAAHVCNMGAELGTLEAGKIADVIVVAGDPLEDIHALEQVRWVVHNGELIRSPEPSQ